MKAIEEIYGIISKIEYRTIGGVSFHKRLANAILSYRNSQIEQLQKENEELHIKLNIKIAQQLMTKESHTKLKERIEELREGIESIIHDGKPSESKISFDVMTGRYYFNKLKQLLNKQN